jgi:hypothetical protein
MLTYKNFFQVITQISYKKSINLIYYNKYYIRAAKDKKQKLFLLDNTINFLHVLIQNVYKQKKKDCGWSFYKKEFLFKSSKNPLHFKYLASKSTILLKNYIKNYYVSLKKFFFKKQLFFIKIIIFRFIKGGVLGYFHGLNGFFPKKHLIRFLFAKMNNSEKVFKMYQMLNFKIAIKFKSKKKIGRYKRKTFLTLRRKSRLNRLIFQNIIFLYYIKKKKKQTNFLLKKKNVIKKKVKSTFFLFFAKELQNRKKKILLNLSTDSKLTNNLYGPKKIKSFIRKKFNK